MKRTLLTATFGAVFLATAAHAEPINLTLSGGNPGGLWSLLGVGIDSAVKADDSNSVVTYQATGGGFANIGLLAAYRTDLGLLHDAEGKIALNGGEPFKAPIENMRSIGYMYNWAPMHFFLKKDMAEQYGIDSIDDIATSGAPVRIGINRSGNITSNVALKMLELVGVTEAVIEEADGQFVRAGANEQGELLQDGRLDMITNGIFIQHSSFRAVDENADVVLLSVPSEVIEATNVEFGTGTMVIPAGSYKHQKEDVETVALGALLDATDRMDEDVAYSLASSLIKNVDQIQGVHKSMQQLTRELLAKPSVIEFHSGAAKAYKDAGLLK